MRRAGGLFERLCSFANLLSAFHDSAAGLRSRWEVQAFEVDLERNLWRMHRQLARGEYRWGAYRRFLIRDPKRREIRAAPFPDRVVHHAIFNVLDPLVRRRLIPDTYACISGRGTHAAVARFRTFVRARGGRGYALQCDVSRYFASVDHRVLMGLLARVVREQRLLDLLRSLVEHGAEEPGRGMPIGNLTSQMFANLYLDPLDHFVREELRASQYLRYMDDVIVLCADRGEGRELLRRIEHFLATRLRLALNPRRIRLAPLAAAWDVLGYVHHPEGRRRVRRRSVRRLVRRIPRLAEGYARGEVEWDSVRASLASWFGHARHADAFRLSRAVFTTTDVRNLGQRLLVRTMR